MFTESESRLAIWKEKLSAALGKNRLVLAEFIPELDKILGKTPEDARVSAVEAQQHLHLILQDVLQSLSSPEHPLVIFFDNLQWADAASLTLMQQLLTRRNPKALLIIGAYRAHEIPESHDLYDIVETLQKHQIQNYSDFVVSAIVSACDSTLD